jgi:chloramphenicol 3-O phosphotransferase
MPSAGLIILNGGSSAGKTSLGRAMQDLLPECHMLLGIDAFWLALSPEQLLSDAWTVVIVRARVRTTWVCRSGHVW